MQQYKTFSVVHNYLYFSVVLLFVIAILYMYYHKKVIVYTFCSVAKKNTGLKSQILCTGEGGWVG